MEGVESRHGERTSRPGKGVEGGKSWHGGGRITSWTGESRHGGQGGIIASWRAENRVIEKEHRDMDGDNHVMEWE